MIEGERWTTVKVRMGLEGRTGKTRNTQGMAAFYYTPSGIVLVAFFLGFSVLYHSVKMAQLAVRDFRELGFCAVGYLRVLSATGIAVIGLSCILGAVWYPFFLGRGKR